MNSRLFLALASTGLLVACVGDAAVTPLPDSGTGNDAAVTVDSGTDALVSDAGADVTPGPWTPKKLPALALWLDGSLGVTTASGNKVTKWADQSGNGNDAIQQNTTLQPLLSSNSINNRDCLYFDMTGSPVALNVPSPVNAKMNGDFTVMVVFKTDLPTTSAADLFSSEAASTTNTALEVAPPDLIAHYTVSGSGKAAFAPQAIFNDKKPHVVGMRKSAAKVEILADGASASVTNPPPGDVSGKITIGGQLKGPICEVVLATGTVDQPALDELTAYLKKKYAVP